MQPDLIGSRYRVANSIGQGGMGTVWLARDEVLQRDVAVKQVGLLPGESVTDSARALREARSSAALSNRNVVTVFDVVEEDQAIWLVMEHVPSQSLSDIIRDSGPLEPAVVADIGAQVADGLAAAHAAGTTHRDVKPGNVLVRDDGVAKISDFGIARTVGDATLTQSGLVTGTPAYFSPELARGAAPDQASDVWALGATLYAAVEGRPAYRSQENAVAVLHQIATESPPPPKRADFLEPVLSRMLDRDPASRWSMADAAHALHRLARQHAPENTREQTVDGDQPDRAAAAPGPPRESQSVDGPTRTTPSRAAVPPTREPEVQLATRGRPDQPRSRHRAAFAAGIALLLLLVGGAAWVLTQVGDDSPSAGEKSGGASGSSSSPSKQASDERSSTSGPKSSGNTSAEPGSAGSKAAFIRSYFEVAPGGTDEGWSHLGPGERSQGRASYDSFWSGIESVDVSTVRPVADDSVVVTLTYHRRNGESSTEHKRFDLIRSSSGEYLINGERPVG